MKKIVFLLIIVLSITSCKQKSIEERFTEALYMLDFKTVNKLLKKDDCCTFLKQNEAKFFSYLCKTEEEGSYDLADLLIKNGIDINLHSCPINSPNSQKATIRFCLAKFLAGIFRKSLRTIFSNPCA